MSDSEIIAAVIGRGLATTACVAGATFLAYHDKEGWGWLVFLGVCIGCY